MGARKLVTLALVAVALVLTARYLFWNDRRDVRRRLDTIAETVTNIGGETPPEAVSAAARLGTFVTDDVIIRTDASTFVGGRPAVVKLALDAVATRKRMKVSTGDVAVELIDRSTATVFFTLGISDDDPQTPDPAPSQMHATFVKQDGDWLLTRAEVLRTLEGR